MAKSLSILSLAKPRLSSLGLPASRRTLVVLSRDIPTLVLLEVVLLLVVLLPLVVIVLLEY